MISARTRFSIATTILIVAAAPALAEPALLKLGDVKGEVTDEDARPKSPAQRLKLSGKGREKAEKCLANAVYFEARGEPIRGQIAVAQVVLNRGKVARSRPSPDALPRPTLPTRRRAARSIRRTRRKAERSPLPEERLAVPRPIH